MRDYIVLYYQDGLQMEHFPGLYAAQLWVSKHGGWIVKAVDTYEKEKVEPRSIPDRPTPNPTPNPGTFKKS